jgi:hypothetical protein
MSRTQTVVKYAPVMRDRAMDEFPSLIMIADTEEEAREFGRNANYHVWTGVIAKIIWERPLND